MPQQRDLHGIAAHTTLAQQTWARPRRPTHQTTAWSQSWVLPKPSQLHPHEDKRRGRTACMYVLSTCYAQATRSHAVAMLVTPTLQPQCVVMLWCVVTCLKPLPLRRTLLLQGQMARVAAGCPRLRRQRLPTTPRSQRLTRRGALPR